MLSGWRYGWQASLCRHLLICFEKDILLPIPSQLFLAPRQWTLPPPIVIPSHSIVRAVFSFPAGSAGGPDGLRPQHLKDMCMYSIRDGSNLLVDSLSSFVNFVTAGNVPLFARPFFFGARLMGLNKRDGGIRPIAIGCTLRRLVAKCVCSSVSEEMSAFLSPAQIGFGTPLGAEAAVHAGRTYLAGLKDGKLLLKLDFRNAFNRIRRNKMLSATFGQSSTSLPAGIFCIPWALIVVLWEPHYQLSWGCATRRSSWTLTLLSVYSRSPSQSQIWVQGILPRRWFSRRLCQRG